MAAGGVGGCGGFVGGCAVFGVVAVSPELVLLGSLPRPHSVQKCYRRHEQDSPKSCSLVNFLALDVYRNEDRVRDCVQPCLPPWLPQCILIEFNQTSENTKVTDGLTVVGQSFRP